MVEIEVINQEKEFLNIKARAILRKFFHSDEGLNHWNDLYEIFDEKTKCNGSCPNPAKFLLYTHWHDNLVTLIPACDDHSPQMWFEILENFTAG